MSPILVRPVREQLEHDRIIRLLHGKFRRKYEAAMNPGTEQNAAVGSGPSALYPDLVLLSPDRGHRLQIIVEVETGESVNHLEALAQWAHYARIRAAFHLYVPAGMVDVARRLCEDNHIQTAEIWSYHIVGDEPRFTLVHRNREVQLPAPRPRPTAAARPAANRSVPPTRKASSPSRPKPGRATKTAKAGRATKSKASSPKKAAIKKKRK